MLKQESNDINDKKVKVKQEKIIYTCKNCDKKFPNEYKLNRHLNRKYPCNRGDQTQCKYCKNFFYDSSTRKRHEESSCDKRPLKK